jgi:hypothetical protein
MPDADQRLRGTPYEPTIERTTMRKVYARLLPFSVLCMFICFLDRVNVGFAALTMNKDLGFSAYMFGLGAGLFYGGYCLFEIPSNLVLERVGARFWRRASDAEAQAGPSPPPPVFQRLAVDAGNDAGDQPARLAHLNDDQRTILIQNGERSAQIIRLWHGALRRLSQRRWCLVLAARPIASLGLLAMDLRAQEATGQERLIGLRAIGGVGQTSPAVLFGSISSASNAPSWRAASVNRQRRIRRCRRSMPIWFL